MKNIIFITTFLFSIFSFSQRKTATVLIKEENDKSWTCPSQQTEFRVLTINQTLPYDKQRKMIEGFKNQMKNKNKKNIIKSYDVSMDAKDFLVIYEYYYQYSDKKNKECKTSERRIIKGFPISDLKYLDDKLQQKLDNNYFKDKYLRHKILEIQIPFITKDASWFNTLSDKFRKLVKQKPKKKKKKKKEILFGPGIRG